MTKPDSAASRGQYLSLAGAAFTALMVLGTVAFPMPPGSDVSPASNPRWLAGHYNAAIAQSYVRALAALAFIALAASIAAACRRALPAGSPLPAAALVGGAFSGGLILLGQATGVAAALFVHAGGSADTTRALGELQNGFLNVRHSRRLAVRRHRHHRTAHRIVATMASRHQPRRHSFRPRRRCQLRRRPPALDRPSRPALLPRMEPARRRTATPGAAR